MNQLCTESMLNECRQLMTRRLRTSVSKMIHHAEDNLFELASMDNDADGVAHYIEAVREMRMKKREIQVRFENRLIRIFDETLYMTQTGKQAGRAAEAGRMLPGMLSETPGMAIDAINKAAERVRTDCRKDLLNLDRHVQRLLHDEQDSPAANPMQPESVLGAFWDSCSDIRAGADISLFMVDMFEKYVVADLQNFYEDMNDLLSCHELSANTADQSLPGEAGDSVWEEGHSAGLVAQWMLIQIDERLQDCQPPQFIADFLRHHWRRVLEQIYESLGNASPEWQRAMQVMEDLLISAQAGGDRDMRRQQIWMLPGLIYRLKAGMKAVSIPLKQQTDFLSDLKNHHIRVTESLHYG